MIPPSAKPFYIGGPDCHNDPVAFGFPEIHKKMDTLLDRFCRYARIDTQADEKAMTYPSSPGQLELGKLLVKELHDIGLGDAEVDDHGIVLATIPATNRGDNSPRSPVIAWIAHLDTSPETSGHNVQPVVHRSYDGR